MVGLGWQTVGCRSVRSYRSGRVQCSCLEGPVMSLSFQSSCCWSSCTVTLSLGRGVLAFAPVILLVHVRWLSPYV